MLVLVTLTFLARGNASKVTQANPSEGVCVLVEYRLYGLVVSFTFQEVETQSLSDTDMNISLTSLVQNYALELCIN